MATYVFVAASIFSMFFAAGWFRKIRHQQVNAIASIVTVIGVLGTFAGIAWGLLNFDTGDIEGSVPTLLDGLKVAFLTSIAGIFGSIYLKCSTLNRQKKLSTSEHSASGATVDDLVGLLKEILAVEKKEREETRDTLRSIEKSLTGEGESTIVTQLQKLRTTFSDKQDELVKAFNDFADKMAENNMEALRKVIENFNRNLTDQFGDNFKQLNEAVGRINDWQEQYRAQMDQLAEEFRIAAKSVEKSRESLEVIKDRSAVIVSSAENLEPILKAMQHHIQQLEASLDAFSKLADNAREAFPMIETRLDQLTKGFSNAVQTTIEDSHASMERHQEAVNDFSDKVRESIDNSHSDMIRQREAFQNFTGRVETVVQDTSRGLERTIEETTRKLENAIQTQSGKLNSETERIFRDSTNLMRQHITALDESLGEELKKALTSLGSQLTSLSGKFVADYTPLTERLREVVQIARNMPTSERLS